MNCLLADTLSFLNGLVATINIVAGAAVGHFSLAFASQRLAARCSPIKWEHVL